MNPMSQTFNRRSLDHAKDFNCKAKGAAPKQLLSLCNFLVVTFLCAKRKNRQKAVSRYKEGFIKTGFISITGLPFFNNFLVTSKTFSIHVFILLSLPSMKDQR